MARRPAFAPSALRRGKPTAAPAQSLHLSWCLALIVLAGVLTYTNSTTSPFLFDDLGTVVRNPQITDLSDLGRVLSPLPDTAVAGRPLVNLSFALNYAMGGLDPRGYHVVNIAFHVLCGLLVFGLLRRTLSVPIGLAVALLWIVHPLNSEVVDYVTERTESMMAFCYLLTMYAGLRALDSRRRAAWYAVAVIACTAGMACKESMITVPLMVALYDRTFRFDSWRAAFRSRWKLYAALAATWSVLALLLARHGQTTSAGFATAHVSTWAYLLNQTVMITRYLRLALWPHPLVLYYGWARAVSLADVWPYALFIVLLALATVATLARRPRLGFIGAWFFITLAPASSFIPIATEVGAERRMYLPLIGLIALVVVGTWRWIGSTGSKGSTGSARAVGAGALAVLTLALAATTFVRNREYASPLTMAETVLARWPTANAHQLVGVELSVVGRRAEAISHLREAVPGYPPARYFLGAQLVEAGQMDEAIAELQAFVREEPNTPVVPAARMLLGRAFLAKQQWAPAIEQGEIVLKTEPSNANAHGLLAEAYGKTQAFAQSIPHYQAYLGAHPGDGVAWTGLGIALISTGKTTEALDAFRRAVTIDPRNAEFRNNLAIAERMAGIK